MYLQSLELVGFKSFAQKTRLDFNRGVTAIVGPNGCGKSNVLDAIRWVLGEQSAKALRGGEMADVIFSGTESRPALGMAEVSLTFAECEKDLGVEWNEVRITRRTFRDGRSEYLLNNATCRLKDIHQLFMDTGIGRSAYSIMEQGKLDQILSSRPEDRRTIFEEAAGITKYKAQKKEALRKLDHTEANLLRVTDIIKEVKRQIASLQRQAAKARRFQSLINDLRIFDTHLSYKNYETQHTEWNESCAEIEKYEDLRRVAESQIEIQETELAKLRTLQEEISLNITSHRDQLQILKNRIFSSNQRIETHGHRKIELTEFITSNQAEIETATLKLREQKSQITETNQLIEDLLEKLNNRQQELNDKETVFRNMRELRITTERNLQNTFSEINRLEGNAAHLREEISSAEGKRNAVEIRTQILNSEASLIQSRLEETRNKLESLKTVMFSAHKRMEEVQEESENADLHVQEIQKVRQQVEAQLKVQNKTLAEQESRLKVLAELNASGEGFDEGTQVVLQGLDQPNFFKPAIVGVLASFIEVTPNQHIPAVEAALGSSLQTILVKDISIAESILKTLISKKLGRASLLPRTWMEFPPSSSEPAALPEGAISWVLNSVHCSEDLYPLIRHLLSHIVLVSHLELAFQLKQQYPGYGFVTLEGEFISRTGIATVGHVQKATSSTLFRKAQITELEKDLAFTRSELEIVSAKYKQATETWESAQLHLAACRDRSQQTRLENSQLQSELTLEEREIRSYSDKLVNISKEIKQLEDSIQNADEERKKTRLQEILLHLEGLRESETALQNKLGEDRQQEFATSEDLQSFRLRLVADRQRKETLEQQRQPMAVRLAELNEVLEKRREDIRNYENRISSLENEVAELREEIIHSQEELQEVEIQLTELGAQRQRVHENIESLETTLRSARKQLTDLQDQHAHLEVRSSQLKMRLEHLCEHVQKRYQISLPEFQPDFYALTCALKERMKEEENPVEKSTEVPWIRVEALVNELTERVDSMGPVNLEAIQEYEELEQRHTFLEQQNNDLINSKTELLEVISKVNRITKELFAETFEKIRNNFQEMFAELFQGGRSNLLLADESDPLESGIEIIAKPPGKQLQSISLLSGGERTMTAVALLFAIYMVKPSPFCVLDEMDAPLDESNINRFIKILDRFVGQSQFVVITHNKRTISRADMLYGVTMEEHGISKLVGMKFRSKDSPPNTENVAETSEKEGDPQSKQENELIDTI